MADGDVIREFLVGLGFDVDQEQYRKFVASIAQASKQVSNFGSVAIASATEIELFIAKVSRRMTDLYYASEKAGSSAQNLESLRYAAQGIGVGADQAAGSVEALAAKLRENPGYEGLLHQLGVQTRDANGGLMDTEKIFLNLITRLKQFGGPGSPGFVIASQYANMFGISNDQLVLYEKHLDELKEREEDHNRRLQAAGIDTEKLAAESREFSNALGKLEDDLDIVGKQITQSLIEPATKVVHVMDEIVQAFERFNKASEGWAGVSLAIGSTALANMALKALAVKIGLFGVKAGAKAAEEGVAALATAAGASSVVGIIGILARAGFTAFAGYEVGHFIGQTLADNNINLIPGGGALANHMAGTGPTGTHGRGSTAIQTPANILAMLHESLPELSPAQLAGVASRLRYESGFNPTAVGDKGSAFGLAQWHPDRQAAFARMFGHDIQSSTAQEQIQFLAHELHGSESAAYKRLLGATTPGEAYGAFTSGFERPANANDFLGGPALADKYAKGGASLSQSTTVNVYGATDPQGTASAIANEQNRVNGDLARDLSNMVGQPY